MGWDVDGGIGRGCRLNLQKTWELRRAEMEAGSSIAERVTPWGKDRKP